MSSSNMTRQTKPKQTQSSEERVRMQGKKFNIPTLLLKLCCTITILFWIFPAQLSPYVFFSPASNPLQYVLQILLSPLIAGEAGFSPQAVFDLGFTCFFLRLFSSFIVSFLGEKRFLIWYAFNIIAISLLATPYLQHPLVLSNALLMGMATLFCSLSSGRPIFIAIFPLPPKQIFILSTVGWILFPLLLQNHSEAVTAASACLLNLGIIKFVLKQPLSFF